MIKLKIIRQFPRGYSLLFGVLILVAMLMIGLTVTGIFIHQLKLSTRITDAAKALNAADSGIERVLYIDFILSNLPPGVITTYDYTTDGLPPFDSSIYNYYVEADTTGAGIRLESKGLFGSARRSVEVNY